jgi:hypothetical protein
MLFLIKAPDVVTADLVDQQIVPIANLTGQMTIKKVGKAKPAVYELSFQQAPISVFAAIPEDGVVIIGPKRDAVEASAKAKAKVDADLKNLIGKRSDKDFIFAAGIKGKGDDRESFVGNLVLDKDVSGKFTATAPSTDKAKEWKDKADEGVTEAVDKLKELLGDGAANIKAELEKIKAKQDGKTVTLEGKIPGAVFEKLLAKE